MSRTQIILQILTTAIGSVAILAPLVVLLLISRHTRGISAGKGRRLRQRPFIYIMSIGLVVMGFLLWRPLPIQITSKIQDLVAWIGFLIYLPAIIIYLWGLFSLGGYFGVSNARGADLHSDHKLIRHGPYRFIRHPMYLGVIMAAMGAFLIFLNWAMVVFLPMSFIVVARAKREDELLASYFGNEWNEYANHVGKWWPKWSR